VANGDQYREIGARPASFRLPDSPQLRDYRRTRQSADETKECDGGFDFMNSRFRIESHKHSKKEREDTLAQGTQLWASFARRACIQSDFS